MYWMALLPMEYRVLHKLRHVPLHLGCGGLEVVARVSLVQRQGHPLELGLAVQRLQAHAEHPVLVVGQGARAALLHPHRKGRLWG